MFGKKNQDSGKNARNMWNNPDAEFAEDEKEKAKILFYLLLAAVTIAVVYAFSNLQ